MIYDMYGQSWYSGRTLDSFWGLYIVGSRAREEARDDSDLDVLSVGNIGRSALEMRDGWSLGVQLKDPLRQVYGREEYFNDEPSTDDERLAEYFRPFFYRGERTDVSLRRIAPDKPSMGTRIGIDLMVQANPLAVDFDADKFRELDVDEDDLPLPKIPLIELAIPSHKKRKELLS
jgi:predicted nucleotidyltransferase